MNYSNEKLGKYSGSPRSTLKCDWSINNSYNVEDDNQEGRDLSECLGCRRQLNMCGSSEAFGPLEETSGLSNDISVLQHLTITGFQCYI
ncbi:hypothetical protein YC2023_009859 [Brassica napus]